MRRSQLRYIAAIVLGLLFGLAAPVGAQSITDSDTSDVRIVKGNGVLISEVDDWLVGIFAPDDSIARRQGNFDYICVHSTTGLYRIDVSSTNGGPSLNLQSSAGDSMDYLMVVYSYAAGASRTFPNARQEFTTPFTLTNRLASPTLSCVGQGFGDANLYIAAAVDPADFNAAPAGVYQDIVVMTVSAE